MLWNWQRADWPKFAFDAAPLRDAEARFLKGAGVVVGSMHYLDGEARQGIVIELIAQEMVDSSAIEGEILDRASVQSSIARQLGFAADRRRSNPAEAGAALLIRMSSVRRRFVSFATYFSRRAALRDFFRYGVTIVAVYLIYLPLKIRN